MSAIVKMAGGTAAEVVADAERVELETLRGIQTAQAAAKEARAAKAASDVAAKLTAAEERAAALEAKLSVHEQREAARMEVIATANTAALAALPPEVQALAPTGADADAMHAWIAKAAAVAAVAADAAAGGVKRGASNKGGTPHPIAVDYAKRCGLDVVATHNAFLRAGQLPAGTTEITN